MHIPCQTSWPQPLLQLMDRHQILIIQDKGNMLRMIKILSQWDMHWSQKSYHALKEFQYWLYLLGTQRSLTGIPAPHSDMCDDHACSPQRSALNMYYLPYNTLKMASSILKKQMNWSSIELSPDNFQRHMVSTH